MQTWKGSGTKRGCIGAGIVQVTARKFQKPIIELQATLEIIFKMGHKLWNAVTPLSNFHYINKPGHLSSESKPQR